MLLTVERDTISVIRHRIEKIVKVFRVENVPDVCKEGVRQPTNPAPFAKERVNVIG